MVTRNLHGQSPDGSSYGLEVDNDRIKLESYLIGSIAGGAGTECIHSIGIENIPAFLEQIKVESIDAFIDLVSNYDAEEWRKLHQIVSDHQTDSFVWVETDWSSPIGLVVTLDGELNIGSILKAHVQLTSSVDPVVLSYQWESRVSFAERFEIIESANEPTYQIEEHDQGSYIRVRVEAREEAGFNMNSATSSNTGRIPYSY